MISKFLNSSLITSAAYDNFSLLINFSNGTSYMYYNVPYEVFDELVHSDSPGKFYNNKIKKLFKSKKMI